jgi:hypothetical protein
VWSGGLVVRHGRVELLARRRMELNGKRH